MNLPEVISNLVQAQHQYDSFAYAACFSENAVVFDEGKTHKGRTEIQSWIDQANKEYQATVAPLSFNEMERTMLAEVSGNFPGSPIVLKYHFELADGQITSLKITG